MYILFLAKGESSLTSFFFLTTLSYLQSDQISMLHYTLYYVVHLGTAITATSISACTFDLDF